MKIDFKKIDLRQGKYWFPLVLFVPLVAIAYFSCEMFKGPTVQEGMVTDSINTMMPEPAGDGLHGKFAEMEDNLLRGDGYTAINALGEEETGEADDENVYSESEMDRIDKEKAQKKREEEEMNALQQQLRESRMHINQYDDRFTGHSSGNGSQQREMEQFEQEMRQIQERSRKMAKDITGEDNLSIPKVRLLVMTSTAILFLPSKQRKTPSKSLPRPTPRMPITSIPSPMKRNWMTRLSRL